MEHQQESSSNLQLVTLADDNINERDQNNNNEAAVPPGEIRVSIFDYSIDNYFKLIDKISIISGESDIQYQETEIQRLNSSVTFLRKWRDFCYQPRAIRFAYEKETSPDKDRLNLPQFSSIAVPKDMSDGNDISSPLSKDFVMYVGGHVWALDWCPRVHPSSDTDINVEFIAVSAHPPESAYHKIGAPLTGRGLIQIWCILNAGVKDQDVIPSGKGKPKKTSKNNDNQSKRPRGRPRKNLVSKSSKSGKTQKPRKKPRNSPVSESLSNIDGSDQCDGISKQGECPDSLGPLTEFHEDSPLQESLEVFTRKRKGHNKEYSAKSMLTSSKSSLTKCQTGIKSQVNDADIPLPTQSCRSPLQQDPVLSELVHESGFVYEDVFLPRLVMGLAHGGKVAWDVKWRPLDSHIISKHLMGYLAVLLGNGALEVWEVPLPRATKVIFSSSQKEDADPRFVKLKPVFMCSMLKCGDRQSIPLTLEWSTSAPHDLILAGCHDGVVALWKFCGNGPSKDTRPLLCFSADTAPIRALKWAPLASGPESANIIVTGGHGLKFWDIRDPFQPLWVITTMKNINSMDWLPNPSCVVLSFDDGKIRTINLLKAACDVPVTGMHCVKTQQHGFHSYYCSLSSIWSTQVSTTGMVAYCCSDGKVRHFQHTTKEVGKGDRRNRNPHYLCGFLTEEESTLTVFSPVLYTLGFIPRSKRFLLKSNQEKRAKDPISKSQTPPKPPGHNLGSEGKSGASQKSGDTSQTAGISQALVCIDNDNKSDGETVGKHMDIEKEKYVLPPKMVALHCVRWNMNKGSERLLCYGGTAGIVRCQKIY